MFLLGVAGPLLQQFRDLGPTFVAAEGWDVAGLARGLPAGTNVLINTAAAARFAARIAAGGLSCIVLIHEMADYIASQGLMKDLSTAHEAGSGILASMPGTMQALSKDLPGIGHIRPGIVLPQVSRSSFRLRKGYHRAYPVFIGAGHADRRKGFDLFLEAASAISRLDPQAHFVWLGALDVWAQGLADNAIATGMHLQLPGFVTDSTAWYRGADVYLLTSRQDPGPMTAIHAAAVGTPFVGYAADIGMIGMTEGVGEFVPVGQVDRFVATALRLAAETTPQSRRRLRRLIRAETSFSTYVDSLLSQFSHVQRAST